MFHKVEAFQRAFGQDIPDCPTLPSDTIRALRRSLLAEEVAEYAVAERNNDIIEVADALADICYITCGTAIAYGLHDQCEISIIPFSWAPRTVAPGLIGDLSARRYRVENMIKAVRYYEQAEQGNDLYTIKGGLFHILFTAGAIAYDYSIPLSEVFEEVHRSNMTKLGRSGKPDIRADGKILKPPHFSPPNIEQVFSQCLPKGTENRS